MPSVPGIAVPWPRSSHGADGGRCDLFAKYTLTADEALLGEEESGALEQRVAFMAAEGGAEAEQELPFTLLACDAMQARLEAWAEKRARASNLPPPPKGPSRGDAAAKAAERAAERAAEEAVRARERAAEEAVHARARDEVFAAMAEFEKTSTTDLATRLMSLEAAGRTKAVRAFIAAREGRRR